MLFLSTVNVAVKLATKVGNKQFKLDVMPDTPLSELVAHSYSPRLEMGEGEPLAERLVAAAADKDSGGVNQHSKEFDSYVATVARVVQSTLDGARNVAGPLISQAAEEVEAEVDARKHSLINAIQIVPVTYHPVWNTQVLDGLAGRYREQPLLDIVMPSTLPSLSEDDVLALVRVGNTSFDEQVVNLISSKGADWLTKLYENVFTANGRGYDLVQEILRGRHATRDELLCLHLMCRRLVDNPGEGVRQSLTNYRVDMTTMINQTGRAMAQLMQLRQRENDRKLLVLSYPAIAPEKAQKEGGQILVNSGLYNRWIEEGGSPETLIGAYFDQRDRMYDSLLSQRVALERIWERQRRLSTLRVSYQENVIKREAYSSALTKIINDADEDMLRVSRGEYHDRLRMELGRLNDAELDHYFYVVRKLICRTLFPHTDYEKVLLAVDRICEEQPELDVREAALLATIEHVVDWVSTMISSKKV